MSSSKNILLRWLLQRLENLPTATFRESELRAVASTQIQPLIKQGILRYVSHDPETRHFPCPTPCEVGCDRIVGQVGKATVAICEVWDEVEHVALSQADLTTYVADLTGIIEFLRTQNGLGGTCGPLSERCFRVGQYRVGQQVTDVFLALINTIERATHVVREIQGYAGTHSLCLLPTFAVTDVSLAQECVRSCAIIATFDEVLDDRTWQIDFTAHKRPHKSVRQHVPPPRTKHETADYNNPRLAYHCEDRIAFDGSWHGRCHAMHVNGHEQRIADNLMRLLLRLVLELKKGKGGWVASGTLEREQVVVGRTVQQAVSDLRKEIRGHVLEDLTGQQLIENDGRKRYRLSTHPNYVTPPAAGLPDAQNWFVLRLNELKKVGVAARKRKADQQARWNG